MTANDASAQSLRPEASARHLPFLTIALLFSYMAVAMPLAVIPPFVTSWPGYGNALAGIAVGCAFVSTILTRTIAGAFADQRSGRTAMRLGLCLYVLASAICFASSLNFLTRPLAFALLIIGRLLLGVGESYTLVGMHGWGIGLTGARGAGKVLTWTGAAMYGAFAFGGPIGLELYHLSGFPALMALCTILPCLGLAIVQRIPPTPVLTGERDSFWPVLGIIRPYGSVVALQGVGFAVLGAFLSVYFLHEHWRFGSLGLTCFGLAFVAGRLLCGHLPDRLGGLRVATISLAIEAIGQGCIALAPSPYLALAGAVLTGAGCSLIYPSMGVEVVKRVSGPIRATALGGFAAFQDLSYAISGPVAGIVSDCLGYGAIFIMGMICALAGLALVFRLGNAARTSNGNQTPFST
ncbi:arabinose transporter [Asaia bogorensis]|uniref:arabinose transporter n=1 Tax=Asaia bogorensis TaxID=91915 RepID=UPI0028615D80|nr:arabinose transporter [Asaia bogorensis]MDR6181888.1 MFS family permease [Asaia bogorensis NBRC 16594]